MSDYIPHFGQGMVLRRNASRTHKAHKHRSKYGLEQRIEAIANGDAETLIAIAEEYAAAGKAEMYSMCIKYAEQFTDRVIDVVYAPRKGARANANV